MIRNSEGSILGVFWGAIGETTNNVAEINALMIGLDMVQTNGWQPTIVEGDSLIIIQMANKILNGRHVHKLADNWHLIHSLESLRNKLYNHPDVKLLHVRRKANALADLLANHGVEKGQEIETAIWTDRKDEALWSKSQTIQRKDMSHPGCG